MNNIEHNRISHRHCVRDHCVDRVFIGAVKRTDPYGSVAVTMCLRVWLQQRNYALHFIMGLQHHVESANPQCIEQFRRDRRRYRREWCATVRDGWASGARQAGT